MKRAQERTFPVRIPFVERLGLTLESAADGQARLQIDLEEAHLNAWEVAHGGVVMTMLDVAMAFAARSRLPEGMAVATIEMKTSFLRPAEGRLHAEGRLVHKTTTLAFCDASLHDATGELCATATGTFKILRALPVRGRLATQTPSNPQP
jgi:uncharacterized protein (TIGR00369 family)